MILDNFEQFQAGAEFILALLQETTGIKLLITSRSILNLQAEYQWAVAGYEKENVTANYRLIRAAQAAK